MRVLVTGSTGFVGANLVKGLSAAGYQVRALYRSSSRRDALDGLCYEPVVGDVLDPTSLASAMEQVDWVFHAAGVADYWRQGGPARLYDVNVTGTFNVLEAALEAGVRKVVFTSSVAALGVPSLPDDLPMDESATFNLSPTRFPYGHSKHLAEKIAREFVSQGLETVIVNPTVILGPRDVNFISGSIIRVVYKGLLPVIPPGGVNYVDVSDVVAGHIAAAQRGRAGERYILGAHNLTHQQAMAVIAKVLGVPLPKLRLPKPLVGPLAVAVDLFNRLWPGEPVVDGNQVRLMPHRLFFDTSKARTELELASPVPFRDCVERTWRWYRENHYL